MNAYCHLSVLLKEVGTGIFAWDEITLKNVSFFLCNWDWISITFWIMTSFTTTIFFYAHGFLLLPFLDYNLQLFWKLTVNSFEEKQQLPLPPFFSLRIIVQYSTSNGQWIKPVDKKHDFSAVVYPAGRPGMSDVPLLSEISGLLIWFPFPISSLVFSASASCPFCLVIFHLMIYSPEFFSRKLSNIFC